MAGADMHDSPSNASSIVGGWPDVSTMHVTHRYGKVLAYDDNHSEAPRGGDPLSRRQFGALIDEIRAGRPGMSVVVATAYMDEAQRWDWIVAMDEGRVLATGTPAELMHRTGTKDLDDCFIALLPESK